MDCEYHFFPFLKRFISCGQQHKSTCLERYQYDIIASTYFSLLEMKNNLFDYYLKFEITNFGRKKEFTIVMPYVDGGIMS